ncbi:MutS-related protein [Pseudobacter ginsenosidimutans]|uniref:MutS-like protein n=1 Tax=Pseudobacter ginsenosidimutans TaxID=661488 RepID=A0A4Q7N4I3_9BACT|nr:DNA mismatch repair protein [Pseudobacter ginsenosidimutans]QEC44437.1 DNA mismatch repair protein [Pseudobacter ginsenosidimutans]RZS75908.1 MutS-like protein [Pseudobacter ginsenosidimutans]
MNFTIDKQSLDELNLLGKFRQGSVYSLFNQVKTRGGEQLLDQLFRTPLTDAEAINRRTAVFRFFQESKFQFPFDAQQVVLMREYVDAESSKNYMQTWAGVLLKKCLSSLTRDERYKALIQGLQATIVTMKKCFGFASSLSAMTGPYQQEASAILQILQSPEISRLIDTDIYTDISVGNIARYDHLLKNKLNKEIRLILDFIAASDVNIAVGNIAAEKGFTYARAMPKERNILRAIDLKHPSIGGAIGNTIEMAAQQNVIFLTGANMAGKSTWMKSIGIGMYLAHIGFPVAAKSMEFSVREGIYSSINVADNIALGYSHFYAEVVRVKNAADATATGKHLLLMFDELFKGTNVKDAFDGTLAVTESFAEYTNCLFIVSTHIIEVGAALKNRNNIQFTFMPTVLEGSVPRYTYRLQEGITEDRQGMMIIRNEGILELIGN